MLVFRNVFLGPFLNPVVTVFAFFCVHDFWFFGNLVDPEMLYLIFICSLVVFFCMTATVIAGFTWATG